MKRLRTCLLIWGSLFFVSFHVRAGKQPRLTVILVIDQLAHCYFAKLSPYLHGGLNFMMNNGIRYSNAYMPHAVPVTGTGHTGLNTGTYAKDHGIIHNYWYDRDGKRLKCDDDSSENAAVLKPGEAGTYNFGKSSHFIMVDGISDQFVLQNSPKSNHQVFSISLKTSVSITTSNKLGKAIWFDSQTGLFTSSKAYFDELPAWLKKFNREKGIDKLTEVYWSPVYGGKQKPYDFYQIQNYSYAAGSSLLNRAIPIERKTKPTNPYSLFKKTPSATQLLFDLAKTCITKNLKKKGHDRLLMWIGISSLDKLAHVYGPNSKETIDLIYHIDRQFNRFIKMMHSRFGKRNVLFVLTSDHGVAPIPEQLHDQGIKMARRVNAKELVAQVNQFTEMKYGISNLVHHFESSQFFFNLSLWQDLSVVKQKAILTDIKTFLNMESYIKNVWTFDELRTMCYEPHDLENYFKQQLFPGRSGQVIVQVYPYVQITRYPKGTTHVTPYEYDTHVPLIIYQGGKFEARHIRKKVWALQLANTLAEILEIPKPSASTFEILPGLFD